MTHHKLYAFLAGAALAALGTAAGAAILDFEALAHDGDGAVFVAGHEEDGFRIASDIDPVLGDMAFGVWGATAAEFNGSTALFNTFVGFGTTLTRLDGGVFTLTSLDVGPLVPDLSGELTFVGTTVAGGTVSRAVAFGPGLAPLTVDFGTAFQDLISVSWAQETENQAHLHAAGRTVGAQHAVDASPEPARDARLRPRVISSAVRCRSGRARAGCPACGSRWRP